jgi:multidrug efflux pump subunit AcrB
MNGMLMNLAQLLRLRGGPQDLPASWLLTILLLTAYMVQNLVTGQQLEDQNAAAKSLLSVCLQVGVLTGLLFWRNHLERFAQTMSALAAAGIFFNIITWILLSLPDPAVNQPILAMLWLAVFIWSLFVDAHIYRHSLSVPFAIGMLVTVLILAASYVLIEMLFMMGNP